MSDDDICYVGSVEANSTGGPENCAQAASGDSTAGAAKRRRIGGGGCSCPGCEQIEDCGECVNCKDKTKFGGPNKKKQKCMLRKCHLGTRNLLNPTRVSKNFKEESSLIPQTSNDSGNGVTSQPKIQVTVPQTAQIKLKEGFTDENDVSIADRVSTMGGGQVFIPSLCGRSCYACTLSAMRASNSWKKSWFSETTNQQLLAMLLKSPWKHSLTSKIQRCAQGCAQQLDQALVSGKKDLKLNMCEIRKFTKTGGEGDGKEFQVVLAFPGMK